jgi:hypothetical protein
MFKWSVRRVRPLLVGTLVALTLMPGNVIAAHRGQGIPDEVAILVSFQQSTLSGAPGQLVARLHLDDGSPVVGVEVQFWREVDFLGPRRVPLGQTSTGPDGAASVAVAPSEVPLHVVASFAGVEGYLAAEGATEIGAVVAGAAGNGDAGNAGGTASLAIVTALMPPLLAFAALAIWLLLLGLAVLTVRAIRTERASARTQRGRT